MSYSRRAISKIHALIAVVIIVAIAVPIIFFIYPHLMPSPTPQIQYKKTLVIAIPEEPEGLDIQQVSWANEIHDLIYQPLVVFDENMNMVCDLAVSWEVTDNGKSIIFHLPQDAQFSSGNPITAQVIKDSIERYRQISPYAEDFAVVSSIEIIDDYTVKLVCEEPPAYLWAVLITVYGAPVDVVSARSMGNEQFNVEAIGSGPYKLKEWVHGSHIVLVRNDKYKTNLPFVENKGPNPYIDEVIIRFIPEDLTRISELEAGNVDIVRGVPVDAVSRLMQNPDIKLYYTLQPGIDYIMVNVRKPPLDDVRVRKAIALAVDRDSLVQVLENTSIPWYCFISPSMMCYNETIEEIAKNTYSTNIDEAKSLLASAGWTDTDGDGYVDKDGAPLELTLLVPVDRPQLKRVGPLIQDQLKQIGIKVNVREFEYSYVRQKTREWDFDLALRAWSWADPDILIYLVHGTIANYTYANPTVDQLLEEGRTVMDPVERTKVYSRIQSILLEDLPMIPLFVNKEYTAVRKNVVGLIVLPPYGSIVINDVKIIIGES